MTDLSQLVSAISAAAGSESTGVRFRQGVIVSVAADYTVTVTVAGSETQISGIKVASHICPLPGATVWLATDGRDFFVIASLAPYGPAFGTMRKSTTQSIANAAFVALDWTSRTDTKAVGVTLGNTGITVNVPGLYQVNATPTFAANSTGNRHSQVTKNGAVIAQGASTGPIATHTPRLNTNALVVCAAGDIINVNVYQNRGGTLDTDLGAGSNVLSVAWIGPVA